jgi:2-methylcitrate dehydratase PrpD
MKQGATEALVDTLAEIAAQPIPPVARTVARHCLLDWFGCAIAGSREPLSQIMLREVAPLDAGEATLVGRCERTGMLTAALINGAMSHALDFDDTHTVMSGHPSVPVMPAVLAVAERDHISGAALISAIVVGVEVECRLGALLNPGHYDAGFHATGTLGAFGAAAAVAQLLGLDREQQTHALALAGTQAAGLKSGFGTMAKPLHAGRAAQNGLLSALLVRGGFTGNPEIIETEQGFARTHAAPDVDGTRLEQLRGRFLITDTLFKYHASCYLTHAAIDAALKLRTDNGFTARDIDAVEVRASAGCRGVCDIAEPTTGLEGKFSLRATTAMALLGDDTSDPAAFSDARMNNDSLRTMRDRITFVPQARIPGTQASVVVRVNGSTLEASADTGQPQRDLDRQWERLSSKFFALASPVIGEDRASALHGAISTIKDTRSVADILALSRPAA